MTYIYYRSAKAPKPIVEPPAPLEKTSLPDATTTPTEPPSTKPIARAKDREHAKDPRLSANVPRELQKRDEPPPPLPKPGSAKRVDTRAPSSYKQVKELAAQREQTDHRRSRETLDGMIQEIKKKSRAIQISRISCFRDVEGNIIGEVFQGDGDERRRRDVVRVGSKSYIKSIGFDFVGEKGKDPEDDSQRVFLRTTAYLTEEGKTIIRALVKSELTKERKGSRPKTRLHKNQVKAKLRRRNTFNLRFGDVDVHVNLLGKLQIFSPCEHVKPLLVTKNRLKNDQSVVRRFNAVTGRSSFKKWVTRTTQEVNRQVKENMELLAEILEAWFEKNR